MNKFLEGNEVVVALSEGHCPSNGPFNKAIIFNGGEVWEHVYLGNHNNDGEARVNCTPEQFQSAVKVWRETHREIEAGSVVILERSRKAPNREPLEILAIRDAYYNGFGHHNTPAQIEVAVDGHGVWVNRSCAKEVILGPSPRWANY